MVCGFFEEQQFSFPFANQSTALIIFLEQGLKQEKENYNRAQTKNKQLRTKKQEERIRQVLSVLFIKRREEEKKERKKAEKKGKRIPEFLKRRKK